MTASLLEGMPLVSMTTWGQCSVIPVYQEIAAVL